MSDLHPVVEAVTARIVARSRERRDAYLQRIETTAGNGVHRMRAAQDRAASHVGAGRELFALFRNAVGSADLGASVFGTT
jgi:phosphogluconate dehydratase